MKLDISRSHLVLLVSAVNDAIKYNEAFLHSETVKDISDYEEHLLSLENLQHWLEDEYRKQQASDSDLMSYDKIVGRNSSNG